MIMLLNNKVHEKVKCIDATRLRHKFRLKSRLGHFYLPWAAQGPSISVPDINMA